MKRPGDWYVIKVYDDRYWHDGELVAKQRDASQFGSRSAADAVVGQVGQGRVVLVRRRQPARGLDFATGLANSTPRGV